MILVFGSLNADLVFDMDALPAPGQTLLARNLRFEAGGKGGNQALAAHRAGADVVMIGATGNDPLADIALQNLRAERVDITGVVRSDAATGCASICTDTNGENQITVALGANGLAKQAQIDDALLSQASHILLQGECDKDQIEALIFRAKDADVQVILNLAPVLPLSERALRNVDVLIVNEHETSELAARFACEATAKGLHITLGIDVVRTLGSEGAEAASLDGLFHVPAEKMTPIDTTGAGDAYAGTLAAALAREEPLALAMRHANKAAAATCMVRGAQGRS